MERDPVCNMELMPGKEEAEAQYQGKTYHFCSRQCRDLFVESPSTYVSGASQRAESQH
ncbi:MAG: YHS domain-containing protein [Chloroflexota bacterium]|nr:YHS domain-containing protein [Chloroflexota bacterium]